MGEAGKTQEWSDTFYSAHDGLRLHARRYTSDEPQGRPVLCLPGLTRNAKDFHALALHLARRARPRRHVYCLDYRGRGRSARDRNWSNYTPFVELMDTLDFMTVAGLHAAAVIGTSRGGIIAMLMAVIRPTAIGVAVLNDIGPVLETRGLLRIFGYVGKTPVPASWDEAARIAREMNEAFFPAVAEADWPDIARQWFADQDGRPVPDYDPRLADAVAKLDLTRGLPDMWPQFTALTRVPTLAIRGENSDILSAETVAEMAARHPRLESFEVDGQGHAPLLREAASLDRIGEFLAQHDPPPTSH